ncbi:mycofactocin system transcriptional regulator [Streptomyces shenzhenensis]
MEPRANGVGAKSSATRPGRPPATSRDVLERIGFELFARQGFDQTTIEDIVAAAGISRRTFFRYFASKNDLVWGDFRGHLDWLERLLAAADASLPLIDALRGAVVEFNSFDPAEVPWHRQRMDLILSVPTLQADATLRYEAWRRIVTEFAARRTGLLPSDMVPRLIGHAALAAALTAYETWLSDPDSDLADLLDTAVRQLAVGLDALDMPTPGR